MATALTGLDAGKVADLAKQIAEQEKVVESARDLALRAANDLNSEQVRLSNLKSAFTKVVAGHLDDGSLISLGIPRRGQQA
jgi:hypothetical protein